MLPPKSGAIGVVTSVNITDCVFNDNRVGNPGEYWGLGGAIAGGFGGGTIYVNSSRFF